MLLILKMMVYRPIFPNDSVRFAWNAILTIFIRSICNFNTIFFYTCRATKYVGFLRNIEKARFSIIAF